MNRLSTLLELEMQKPDNDFLLFAIGLEYISVENWNKAKDYLERLREKHPDYTATYLHLGKIYEQLNENEKAIDCYENGLIITKEKNEQKNWRELNEALTNLLYD